MLRLLCAPVKRMQTLELVRNPIDHPSIEGLKLTGEYRSDDGDGGDA